MLATLIGAGIGAAANYIGGQKTNKANAKINERNIALQKEFAQSGIQWRVADAKAAGIHPLAALGAQTHSYAPQSIGMDYSHMGRMGQDIGRAVQTAAHGSERKKLALYNEKVRQLNLKNMELRNAALASQIAVNTQAGQQPRTGQGSAMLIDGQPASKSGSPGLIKDLPQRRTIAHPERLWSEPGAVTDSRWVRTKRGWTLHPSADAKRGMEDMLPLEIEWLIRNKLVPLYTGRTPPVKPGKGKYWRVNPFTGEHYKSRHRRPWEHMRR